MEVSVWEGCLGFRVVRDEEVLIFVELGMKGFFNG